MEPDACLLSRAVPGGAPFRASERVVAEPTVQVLTDGWGEKLLIEAIKIHAGIYHQGPQPG